MEGLIYNETDLRVFDSHNLETIHRSFKLMILKWMNNV